MAQGVIVRATAALAFGVVLAAGLVAPARASSVSDKETVELGTYSAAKASDFTVAARAMPKGLVDALADNPGISGAEYLARAQAAIDATSVVDSLRDAGLTPLGTRLDGTELVVNVATAKDASLVELTGATAELGAAPTVKVDVSLAEFVDRDLYGGSAYYFANSTVASRCSVGFNGHTTSTGADQFVTAGHCRLPNPTLSGYYHRLDQNTASRNASDFSYSAQKLGKPKLSTFRLGGGYDTGLITVASSTWRAQPAILTWGLSENGAPNSAQTVTDGIPAIVGAPICKSGSTTGWTCGTITKVDASVDVGDTVVNSIIATICVRSGDSGGAAVIGSAAVGVTSWSTGGVTQSCDVASKYNQAGFFPLYSNQPTRASVDRVHRGVWELAVAVQPPVVAQPQEPLEFGGWLTGGLPGGSSRHRVSVLVDGTTTLTGLVDADGTWSANLRALAPGIHSATVTGTWGTWSTSAPSAPFTFEVEEPPLLAVAASASASKQSVEASRAAYPSTAPVVYLSTGSSVVDLLGAISASATEGGPVLLIKRDLVPGTVAAEIRRLAPDRLVLAGGAGVVTDEVLTQLAALGLDVAQQSANELSDQVFATEPEPAPVSVTAHAASIELPEPAVALGPLDGWRVAYESTAWARR